MCENFDRASGRIPLLCEGGSISGRGGTNDARRQHSREQVIFRCHALERRILLSNAELPTDDSVEQRGELAPDVVEPADIVWVNRAFTTAGGPQDADRFGAVFGTLAPTVRAVIDAAIDYWEVTIGSFNYANSGQRFELEVRMGQTSPWGNLRRGNRRGRRHH